MENLTPLDRRLIAALRLNSRTPIKTLAATLGASRATIQNRIGRLVQNGLIQRFTIDVDKTADSDIIRAIMLIELEGTLARSVTRTLNQIAQITSLHTTNGAWDLVAEIETQNLHQFDEILTTIREIKGVLNSETSILLRKVTA